MSSNDIVIPFMLGETQIRGRFVRLEGVTTSIIQQHDYPPPVAKILAELLASTAGLAELLKYDGIFTLQTKSDGPINLTVVDVTSEGHMRGYAQFEPKSVEIQDRNTADFPSLMGSGYLVFTVDQGLTVDRYQGIVKLEGLTLSECLRHYFDQSEQLKTSILIMSEQQENGTWKAVCLVVQQMPAAEIIEDDWVFIDAVLETITSQEALDFSIPADKFLALLFDELGLSIYSSKPIEAKCRCSEEKIKNFLSSLDYEQLERLLENGKLKMTCEFCNRVYEFERKHLVTLH